MTFRVSARMTHWGIRLVAVGVALWVAGFSQPAVRACAKISCVTGQNGCAPNEHYAFEAFFGTREGAEHFDCIQLTCDEVHPQCDLDLEAGELEVLEHAAIVADRAKVESILDEHPSLTINIERSALQQLDCGGNVVAHIPAPSTFISDLSAVGQR